MKYNFLLMGFTCSLLLASCSNDVNESIPQKVDEIKVQQPEEEYVTVSLGVGGDFISTESDANTRGTATDDIYGINIYYDKDKDNVIDDIYGYGIFNNKDDMKVTLLSRHKYRFECTLVKNGANSLFYGQAFNNTFSGYAYPFQTNNSGTTMLENKFILGTNAYLSGIKSGLAHNITTETPSTKNATIIGINRFYGETDNYEPVDGGKVDIFLKRTIFGAKFIISGVEEGTVTASCGDIWQKTVTTDDEGDAMIYSYPDVYDGWLNDTELTYTLSLSYVSDRGRQWDYEKTQEITFKRNVLTTVNINVDPDLSAAFTVLTSNEEFIDNTIDLYINASGLIDVWVNPEEE